MKLILSRKGLDSSFGGVPSPIFPDGRLCWLPIPEDSTSKPNLPSYDELVFGGRTLGDILDELTGGRSEKSRRAHLDPDVSAGLRERCPGWRPAFGQTGAAERHLRNHGVSSGDLFLFFGWFRQTELVGGSLRFVRTAQDVHVIYGWLQVERRLTRDLFFDCPSWLSDHPHAQGDPYGDLDSIYLSAKELLGFEGLKSVPGAGSFSQIRPGLVLTAPSRTRSIWRLPADFFPGTRSPLSYHADHRRWSLGADHTILDSVGRGQEFVLDLEHYRGVRSWIVDEVFDEAR